MAELASQHHHGHHGAGAVLLAMPGLQPIPEFVVTGRPTPSLAPLLQRLGSGQRARLVAEHIKVVLKVQHLLAAAVTALVARNPLSRVPDLDVQRVHARFHPGARFDRHRVQVGLDRDTASLVHQGKHDLGQVEPLGQN